MEKLQFLTREQIKRIQNEHQLPVYVYSEKILRQKARECLAFPNAFGLTVRYAMKANPNLNILKIFAQEWLYIDASSSFEAHRAIQAAGVQPNKIQLTTQEFRYDLSPLMALWVHYNATSLYQLEEYGKRYPGSRLSIRINPGTGSWWTKRTSTGGVTASFGIRHWYIADVQTIAKTYNLTIDKIHIHIGSWSDPKKWEATAQHILSLVEQFPEVTILNLGWWFKVARMQSEIATNLQEVGETVKKSFQNFYEKTGRKLHLEIEPGTYVVANAGAIVGAIEDIVDTWEEGNMFIKSDIGMPDILRPTIYGSQHPIIIVNDETETQEYVVVWPCCESGDILTPSPGNPEEICPRVLQKAHIGDPMVVEWAGAYCASMSARNYNSYPAIAELLVKEDGDIVVIKKHEELPEVWRNEIDEI